jgi:hypothetical protein
LDLNITRLSLGQRTWFGNGRMGHGLAPFETAEQAKQGSQETGLEFGGVVVMSSEVYRLHAEASLSPVMSADERQRRFAQVLTVG